MGVLIVNEMVKLFKKKSSWIMPLLVVLAMFGMAMMQVGGNKTSSKAFDEREQNKAYDYQGGIDAYELPDGTILTEEEFWQNEDSDYEKAKLVSLDVSTSLDILEKEAQKYTKLPKSNEYEISEKKAIQKKIAYFEAYQKAGELPPNNRATITSAEFFSNFGKIYILTTLIAVIVASTMVAAEFTSGTIKLLLTRPFSRTQVLLSKYFVTLLYGVGVSLLMAASAYVFSWLLPKQSLLLPLGMATGARTGLELSLSLFGSNFLLMIFYVTVAFFFSAVVRSQALAVGIGMSVLFSGSILGQILPPLIERYDFLKWLIFNMLNLNTRVIDASYVVGGNLSITSMVVGISIYTVLLLAITLVFFNKRDVALS